MRSARARLSHTAPIFAGQSPAANTLGAVLIGGASSRFGSDKSSAIFRGRTLLDNALDILKSAGLSHVAYVGGSPRPHASQAIHIPDRPTVTDERCALRGVVSALHEVSTPLQQAVIIACDLPLLTASTVRRVLDALHDHEAAVAHGERDHWSCVAFRRSALTRLEKSLAAGKHAMHEACADLQLARVLVDEAEFANVNTRAELDVVITAQLDGHR